MIAHQKIIRERLRDNHPVPADFSAAVVREISLAEAKPLILRYEYLKSMGSARRAFGLYFADELAGAVCFGATGGTNTARSVCGPKYAARVCTLVRGACVSWASPNSASYLITRACKFMAKEGKNIFIGYGDPLAGERGAIYRICSWYYCGMTGTGRVFQTPSGKRLDERNISNLARDRRAVDERNIEHYTRARSGGGVAFIAKPTRAEMKARMVREGYTFHPRTPKYRYVGIYADRRLRKELIAALRWKVVTTA